MLKRRLMVWACATAFTLGTAGPALAELEVGKDIGIYSQYVWRGVTQTANAPAVQGDLSVGAMGFTGTVWFSNAYAASNGQQAEEFDWVGDYSGSAGPLGYSVGAIYYTYMFDGHSNFAEVYAGGSFDGPLSPSVTVYYTVTDTDSAAYLSGDLWVDLGVSGSAGGIDLSGTLSFVNWATDTLRTKDLYQNGLSVVSVGASKDVEVAEGVTMTPSLTYTMPLASDSADGNQYIYGVMADSEFIAAVNFAY